MGTRPGRSYSTKGIKAHTFAIISTVEGSRKTYMMDTLDTHHGLPQCVRRMNLFEDVIELYKNKHEQVLVEFAF